ncbi:uncharacterized protein LOC142761752 isoform X2 [Rhipicephalus microplus]|uniref:uncharacterized protein LOC142761752 isoform X2 n=1 Tax=Rhipicephalus microplus TaxID=6941 RepID=UPI003F6AC44A
MGKKRLSFPDTVFYDIDSEEETTEKHSKKKKRKKSATKNKEAPKQCEFRRRACRTESARKREEPYEAAQEKKNKRLEERIEILEKRNDKLQDMLQNEHKTLASRSCCGHQCSTSTSTNHGAYKYEATHRSIQEKARQLQFMQPSLHASPPSPPPPSPPPLWPCSPLSPQGWSATLLLPPPQRLLPSSPSSEQPRMQQCPLMLPVPHPGTTSSGSQEPTSQGMGASDELPLFSQVDNQEKWAWLLSRPRDSLFCKEATKFLWGVSALHNRSITGAPCRRYVRSENQAPPRRALTPKKLEAVGNAFSKYIAGRPSEVAAIERGPVQRHLFVLLMHKHSNTGLL